MNPAPSPSATLRVLVVDDDADARLLTRIILEDHCAAEVTAAETVAGALEALPSAAPDVIITDAMMPGEDGLALLNRLRALPSAQPIPVLVLTASTDPQLDRRLIEAGAAGIVRKPCAPPDLASAVRSAHANARHAR